jgi:hypothetical protein
MGPINGVDKWIEEHMSAAAYVFLAKVTKTSASPVTKFGMLDSASVQIIQQLKGKASFKGIDSNSLCPNFRLTEGETRVFFVDATGMIEGCSDYKYFAGDRKIVDTIKRLSRP